MNKLDLATPTSVILKQCGWLSVPQLVEYHSVLIVYKVFQTKQPKPLLSMFPTEYKYINISQARGKSIKQTGHPSTDLRQDGFRWSANLQPITNQYQEPSSHRNIGSRSQELDQRQYSCLRQKTRLSISMLHFYHPPSYWIYISGVEVVDALEKH